MSVVKGDADNYHAIVNVGCGSTATKVTGTFAAIVSSTEPDRNYTFSKAVTPPTSFNPHMIRSPNGTYLLYFRVNDLDPHPVCTCNVGCAACSYADTWMHAPRLETRPLPCACVCVCIGVRVCALACVLVQARSALKFVCHLSPPHLHPYPRAFPVLLPCFLRVRSNALLGTGDPDVTTTPTPLIKACSPGQSSSTDNCVHPGSPDGP